MTPCGRIPHGTANGYNNYKCRCVLCREAWRVYHANRVATPCVDCGQPCSGRYKPGSRCRDCAVIASRTAEHGTESCYSWGCRCAACRRAGAEARRRRRVNGRVLTHNSSGYANGCRCDVCREARRVKANEYRARRRAAA